MREEPSKELFVTSELETEGTTYTALDRLTIAPFRTGIFRVEAYLVCNDPPAVLRADDHFVAGFAWGE